jgi:predicted NBD/HSP70 family sugar kinase
LSISKHNLKSGQSNHSGPSLIRQTNRFAILHSIRETGPGSRSEITNRLGLSAAGVSAVVEELILDGLVIEGEPTLPIKGQRGRPITPIMLNPDAAYTLGLTLRPYHNQLEIEGSWCNYVGDVSVRYSRLITDSSDCKSTIKAVIEAFNTLSNETPDKSRIAAAGIGIPGIATTERIKFAPNLSFLEGDRFIKILSEELPYPVYLENDVNLSVISELDLISELKQMRFAYLYISSGVGAGVASHGKLKSGSGWVGEIGHINVPMPNGQFNSLEYLLGIDGYLADVLLQLGLVKDDWEELARLYSAGDSKAKEAVYNYSANLYLAIQILNAVADLDLVVIDFPSKSLYSFIENTVKNLISESLLKTEIMLCNSEHHSSVRGAALNALMMSLNSLGARKRANSQAKALI